MIQRYLQNQPSDLPVIVLRHSIFALIVIGIVSFFIYSIYYFVDFRSVILSVYPLIIPVLLCFFIILIFSKNFNLIHRKFAGQNSNIFAQLTNYIRRKNHFTIGIVVTLGLVLFLLPVFHAWHTMSSKNTLFGIFPASDGPAYYMGAKEIIYYGVSESANERRPINTVLFAVRLALTGQNYQGAILIQAILLGLSCILSSFIISRDFGKIAGFFFFILLLSFGRKFVASPLTEALGLSLGTLAFSLLWYGARQVHNWIFAFGIFMMTVALNARPGTLFILPLFLIWVWGFMGKRKYPFMHKWKSLAICLAAIFGGFFIHFIVGYTASGKFDPGQNNFVNIVYAMSIGEDGWQSFDLLPEERQKHLWTESWNEIRENPANLFKSMVKRLRSFITISTVEIFQTVSFFDGAIHMPPGLQKEYSIPIILNILKSNIYRIFDIIFHTFILLGAVIYFSKNIQKRETWFVLLSLGGFYLSGVILGNVAIPRVIHTTIPFVLIVYIFGISWYLQKLGMINIDNLEFSQIRNEKSLPICSVMLVSIILIVTMITGTSFSHGISKEISNMERLPKSEVSYLLMYSYKGMPHIKIWPDAICKNTFIPDVKIDDYYSALNKSYTRKKKYGFNQMKNINPPITISLAYNFSKINRSKEIYVMGPIDILTKEPRMLKLYGEYLIPQGTNKHFFLVKSYETWPGNTRHY